MHNASAKDCSDKITQLYRTHKDAIDTFISGRFDEKTVKRDFDDYYKKLQDDVRNTRAQLQLVKDKRSKNTSILDSLRRQEEEKEKEIKNLEKKITDQCPNLPLEEALA